MKGIVLAGGTGSRLWPITKAVCKQLLPVYDKPMIYYPISTLMLAGIREILIITSPDDQPLFVKLLGDGSKLGMKFEFATQEQPNGIAEALLIGEKFIGGDDVALILGDNIFYGVGFGRQLTSSMHLSGAKIFVSKVSDPERYGVIELSGNGVVKSIVEKPKKPKSNLAVTGLYFYSNEVFDIVKTIKPSSRGELEITTVNQQFLELKKLQVKIMERGTVWIDTGTFESLNSAGNYIRAIEDRQGIKIGCLEEVAWRNGWVSDSQLLNLANSYAADTYKNYLKFLIEN
jgi:glucose-1-phosphate thymidylyltransferase